MDCSRILQTSALHTGNVGENLEIFLFRGVIDL